MEGRPVSVNIALQLPDTPTDGTLERIPLGGDGFYAPTAAYAVTNVGVTGDGGGGTSRVTITMDPRFCALVSYMTFGIQQAISQDVAYRMIISDAKFRIPSILDQGVEATIGTTISAQSIAFTWEPVPVVLPGGPVLPIIQSTVLNLADDVHDLSAMIYLFNIRAREMTPMGPLLWARGSR